MLEENEFVEDLGFLGWLKDTLTGSSCVCVRERVCICMIV